MNYNELTIEVPMDLATMRQHETLIDEAFFNEIPHSVIRCVASFKQTRLTYEPGTGYMFIMEIPDILL